MTRKEAAEMIKNDVYLHHNYLSGEYRKALRLAISALEQPEIIRCKDCKWKQVSECVRFADVRPFPDDFCSRAERRTDDWDNRYGC